MEEFRVGQRLPDVGPLPVAAMPLRPNESYLVRRGKTRPVLVVATEGAAVNSEFKRTGSSWQHKPSLLVAPYYGIEADGTRGGWNSQFVERIQQAEYPQYVWDILPIATSDYGSILRLDHLMPLGADPANWITTEHQLTDDALTVLDEWIDWHITGTLAADGILTDIRQHLAKLSTESGLQESG